MREASSCHSSSYVVPDLSRDGVDVGVCRGSGQRHKRMLKRGRSGEDNYAYLRKRDAREKKTGIGEIMKNADLKVRIRSNNPAEVERVLKTISQTVGAQ